jgi:hypothetical protein
MAVASVSLNFIGGVLPGNLVYDPFRYDFGTFAEASALREFAAFNQKVVEGSHHNEQQRTRPALWQPKYDE